MSEHYKKGRIRIITDELFEYMKRTMSPTKNGHDFYVSTFLGDGYIVNISYLKVDNGWMEYVERLKV